VAPECFLVTGAHGCIGAWAVRQLVTEGADVVALDLSTDPRRLRLLLEPDELARVRTEAIDITDLDAIERVLDAYAITNVIHLAALQVPFCRANPPLGAQVNVVGTVNLFEAAARRRERMAPIVYASSIAAYEDVEGAERAPSADGGVPSTLYGVYKRANESAAVVYQRERGLASIGLRPHTVYGPGRDQGLTSAPTVAMLAAAAGVSFRIPYGGRFQIQYAPDVAGAFISASRSGYEGASVHNLAGQVVDMDQVVSAIESAAPQAAGLIDHDEMALSFPEQVDASSLAAITGSLQETPLSDGIADTIARFGRLLAAGLVEAPAAGTEQPAAVP
jgi:nucleoside-diphosphate-sugar epimerase